MSQKKNVPLKSAKPDGSTVSADGVSKATKIQDVFVHKPPVHGDHRGELTEMFTSPEFWKADFAYAYQTSIRPGMLKGWFAHEHKMDRYHIVKGELLLLLYDGREDSPSCGTAQAVLLSDRTARQVLIPQRIWHLSLNVGLADAILVNLPSTHYNHDKPDRFYIPYDSDEIPVDVRSFFPVTSANSRNIKGTAI